MPASPEFTADPGALLSAAAFLHRGVRPDGSHEAGSDWEINSHQWGLFISWAYNRGVALPATFAPEHEGGREHDLLFDAVAGRWLKFTKPFGAGFTFDFLNGRFVRRPAAPLSYLRRWRWVNRLFGGDVRLVGLSCVGRTQRIVVSQGHCPGEPPTWPEIDRAMLEAHGLRPVPAALLPEDEGGRRAYGRGRLVIFGVSPAGARRGADGTVRFIDVLPRWFSRAEAIAWPTFLPPR